MGLQRGEDAQQQFLECSRASDGDERAQALRQAARLAFALTDAKGALAVLANVDDLTTPGERRAVEYDRAVYLADSGDLRLARAALTKAADQDERYAIWALADPVVSSHKELVAVAERLISAATAALATLRAETMRLIESAPAQLSDYAPTLERSAPNVGVDAYNDIARQAEGLRDDLESAGERAGPGGLRRYLREDLTPRCVSVVARARDSRLELLGLQKRVDALQRRVDSAARDFARSKHGDVKPVAIDCKTLAPGFVVRSVAVITRPRPLRAAKTWLVGLDADDNVEITSAVLYYRA
jgi:hypothetical protein